MYENNDFNNQNSADVNEQAPLQPQPPFQPRYVTYIPYGLTEETYLERKGIKKAANVIGGCFLALMFFAELLPLLFTNLLAVLGLPGEKIYSIIGDSTFNNFFQIVASTTLFIIPFIIIFKSFGYKIRNIINFERPKGSVSVWLFFIGIAFCAFSNLAVSKTGRIFEGFGINYEVDFGATPKSFFGIIISFISTAIIPPLVEEFACRGLVLGVLRKYGDGFSILASSALFGILHGNFQQIPFAFLVGLVLGYITVKSGSLWLAILIHAFNNGLSFMVDIANTTMPVEVCNVLYILVLTLILLLGLISIFVLKNKEFLYDLEKSKTKANAKQKYKWFFSSATIIIFIVICILESLKYFA